MRWAAGLLVAAVVLFWCYLRESRTSPANSDASGMALQAWDILHGNVLLSGWWLADVTFYTFEIPVDAAVEAVRGLNSDVIHVTAALIYTALVLTAALLARGRSRGKEGLVRAVLAAGILLAPSYAPATRILLGSPDHTGVAVPILLTLLVLDRARERWWVPVTICVMLTWAQVDDPLATFAAALPLALVCAVRAALPLVRRRRPGWYDAGLAVAALASVELTRLSISAIKGAGGYSMQSLAGVAKLVPTAVWGTQLRISAQNILILFGADYYDQPDGLRQALAYVHLAGLLLGLAGLVLGIVSLFRGSDRVNQILTVGAGATFVACTFFTKVLPTASAHEVAPVLPFAAVLAGRTVGPWLAGPWLASRRLPRITLGALLGVALAGYLAIVGYNASLPAKPADTQGLANFLVSRNLKSGLGRYWAANSATLASGWKIRVIAMQGNGKIAYPWVTKPRWYEASKSYANYVVATPIVGGNAYAFSVAAVEGIFGKPAQEYQDGAEYIIMVYHRNLLLEVPPPNQSQVDGHP